MLVVQGTLVHATQQCPLQILANRVLGVNDGKIVFVEDAGDLDDLANKYGFSKKEVLELGDREFLMPGMVDTHIHASQYPNCGMHLDLPLLDWLNKYTFPTEAKFADLQFAEQAYSMCVERTLKNGTTTAQYFSTIHLEASLKLWDIVERYGQRALVGKVCANQNSPEYYCENTEDSLEQAQQFIAGVKNKNSHLVAPVISPRFAPACDMQLMRSLGTLAQKHQLHIQSHLSENRAECQWVSQLFPECSSYTDVYKQAGLLTNKTVLAHGVYLSEEELGVLREAGTAISHCPNSNISLKSGLCDVSRLLQHGVKVGLGTDVSGGYHPSVLDALRMAVQTSNILSMDQGPDYKLVDYKAAFKLATLGGSQALGLEEKIGNFEVGKELDALRVNPCVDDSPLDVNDSDTVAECIQKFLYLGDDRNIVEVYVAGKKVWDRQERRSQSQPSSQSLTTTARSQSQPSSQSLTTTAP